MSSVMFEKVQNIIVEQFEKSPSEVTMESSLVDDLGLDSLDMFDMICALEKEFSFHFDRDMGASIATVGDVVRMLESNFSE